MLATEALEKIHSEATPDLVAILAGLLEDGDAKVRNTAAIALDRLGPKARAAVPALVKALKESPDLVVRRWAASALGRTGAPGVRTVLPALMAALDDPDDLVRTCAIQAIGPFGPEAREAVPKIVRNGARPPLDTKWEDALDRIIPRTRAQRSRGRWRR